MKFKIITKIFYFSSILIIAMALSSCAISKKTYLPDGSEGYSISCDGSAVGINVCFEKAGQLCGARGKKKRKTKLTLRKGLKPRLRSRYLKKGSKNLPERIF